MIQVKHLSKSYKNIKAVDDISFTLRSGEILGFIGPNGAGKSTTIKMLLNYIFPDSGSASILDFDIITQAQSIKKETAYVSSEVNFYPELKVFEILKLTQDFYGIKDSQYTDFLSTLFQLNLNKKMKELSLGNKKKVALVCAFLIKPKVLIMDEPTNGLDPLIQKKLFQLLKQLAQKGCAILVSSHNLKEIQDHCDRVMFIKEGVLLDILDNNDTSLNTKYIKIKGDYDKAIPFAQQILSQDETTLEMTYSGDLSELLMVLATLDLDDISIEPVSMEQQFLSYYASEDHHD